MAIHEWPAGERPREKLIEQGAVSLTEAELLAVFLRTGVAGRSAVDLARQCLQHFGSLNGLLSASLAEFSVLPGLGAAKYAQLQATLELAKRALREELAQRCILSSANQVRDYLRLHLQNKPYEVFIGLFLDAGNKLLSMQELFRGSLTSTSVYPREIVKQTLALNAAALIFAHNHPGGSTRASDADIRLTAQLKQALALIDVTVHDHLIVAGDQIVSLAEQGLI